jgi:hypothetical protein
MDAMLVYGSTLQLLTASARICTYYMPRTMLQKGQRDTMTACGVCREAVSRLENHANLRGTQSQQRGIG